MIKKLLNKILYVFSCKYGREQIENYLAISANICVLKNKQNEIERKCAYNRL